jgi:hypothetical protein
VFVILTPHREETDLSKKFPGKFEELKNKLLEACDGNFKNGLFSF